MMIYCLGPENTYSDYLVKQLKLNELGEVIYKNSFEEIVQSVREHDNSVGIVVIENSITSSIHATMDQLFEHNIGIVGEAYLNIRLHLIASTKAELSQIQTVYSKKEALAQCRQFISKHRLKTFETQSTAEGIKLLHDDLTAGVIGGRQLVASDTKILAENIGDVQINKTRFLLISQTPQTEIKETADKLTVILALPHRTGSLAVLLTKVAAVGGNLSKIESRPIAGTDWEYKFWLDIEFDQKTHKELLQVIKEQSLEYNILGYYEHGKVIET